MATCGYICPSCEGKVFMEDGSVCSWCQPPVKAAVKAKLITDEEWIQSVHFGACCSHPEESEDVDQTSDVKGQENG